MHYIVSSCLESSGDILKISVVFLYTCCINFAKTQITDTVTNKAAVDNPITDCKLFLEAMKDGN